MKGYAERLASAESEIERAAWLHSEIVRVHPFIQTHLKVASNMAIWFVS